MVYEEYIRMSSSFKNDGDYSFDVEEFVQIGTRCRQLRKEKDMLRESQSQSAELIRRLQLDVKTLSEARSEDKKYIQDFERELRNCSQEIEYLQDQLNLRNIEVNYLSDHVHSLELKLAESGNLHEKLSRLREELMKSNSECLLLTQELESKEVELQNSILCIEKLEESISSVALDSQCEIESMKLDMMALEQTCFEAEKFQEETTQEKARMSGLIEEFDVRFQDARKMIGCLEKENKELREKLEKSERNARIFCQKVEEHLEKLLENKGRLRFNIQSSRSKLESELLVSKEMCTCEEVLGPLLSKLEVLAAADEDLKDEMEKMSRQIHESELLVKQLKDELREEKSKANEEAEDLTQEMAELRYQITGMLEQECKRRAFIEQASLQRIAELEAQGLCINPERDEMCTCGECIISRSDSMNGFNEEPVEAEALELGSNDDDNLYRAAIEWHPEHTRVLESEKLQMPNHGIGSLGSLGNQ
ncbi:hypothetical protein HHK36_015437 [Tetracentron sinense]|uniref:Uncharacterized protein n=1 Tax=Tetracentron sinense TaxID=13715 RepID=A0A834Z559_TETSI|nr:hypothetical protein HHK36_015437 [Tetracentron sinense]